MSSDAIARVHYFTHLFLRTPDFADEQAYHLAMRRRHNLAHHRWGIVQGLEIALDGENLFVQPGLAVDGYGRELILSAKTPLLTNSFDTLGSATLDVWLGYRLLGSDPPQPGYVECGADGTRLST